MNRYYEKLNIDKELYRMIKDTPLIIDNPDLRKVFKEHYAAAVFNVPYESIFLTIGMNAKDKRAKRWIKKFMQKITGGSNARNV